MEIVQRIRKPRFIPKALCEFKASKKSSDHDTVQALYMQKAGTALPRTKPSLLKIAFFRFLPGYTGSVPSSLLNSVGSAFICCAWRHSKNLVATCGKSA